MRFEAVDAARTWRGLPGSAGSRRWEGRRSTATEQSAAKRCWLRETATMNGFFLLLHSLPWHTKGMHWKHNKASKKGCARHGLPLILLAVFTEAAAWERTHQKSTRKTKRREGSAAACSSSPRWERSKEPCLQHHTSKLISYPLHYIITHLYRKTTLSRAPFSTRRLACNISPAAASSSS